MLIAPQPMHIPDGFLSIMVDLLLWIAAIIAIGYSLKRVSQDLGERQVPLMGVLAAAIFAGQMLNFTVAGGTSGHLMGAAIATILVGPWAAILVITSVVAVQALIFQDGGLLVLGANIFNMAVIGVAVSFAAYYAVQKLARGRNWGVFVGGIIAGWLSIEITALAVALELSLSGTSPANIAIPAMGGVHALIGIGEGLITVGALAFLHASRPDLINQGDQPPVAGPVIWIVGILIAVGLAFIAPWASRHPDGLEWVAAEYGFLETSQGPAYSLFPDYIIPGIANEAAATVLAGIIGIFLVFGVAAGVAYFRRKRQTSS